MTSTVNNPAGQVSIVEDVKNTNGDYQTASQTTTPDFTQLSELCNEKYMMAKGVQECASLCQPYSCKYIILLCSL